MTEPAEPPAEALAFAGQLGDRLLAAGPVEAAYLHGSAVLGGWIPARSDLDLHAREIQIRGKGSKPRTVKIRPPGGPATSTATCGPAPSTPKRTARSCGWA